MFGKKKKEPVDLTKMNSSSFSYGPNPSPAPNPSVNSPSPFRQTTPYPNQEKTDPYAKEIRSNVNPNPFGTAGKKKDVPEAEKTSPVSSEAKRKKEKKTYTREEKKERRRYRRAVARFVALGAVAAALAGYLIYSLVLLFR